MGGSLHVVWQSCHAHLIKCQISFRAINAADRTCPLFCPPCNTFDIICEQAASRFHLKWEATERCLALATARCSNKTSWEQTVSMTLNDHRLQHQSEGDCKGRLSWPSYQTDHTSGNSSSLSFSSLGHGQATKGEELI